MTRADWIERSACREYKITATDDPWHAEGPGREEHARQRIAIDICKACPVKSQCLAEALEDADQYGIRGALTGPQRTRLKNGQQETSRLAPCGTRAAYQRHLRNGEPTDQACIDAQAAYQAELRERRTSRKAVS